MRNGHSTYLDNQFLIAMPQLEGSEFARALIYLVNHNAEGAMGIVVNQQRSIRYAK